MGQQASGPAIARPLALCFDPSPSAGGFDRVARPVGKSTLSILQGYSDAKSTTGHLSQSVKTGAGNLPGLMVFTGFR